MTAAGPDGDSGLAQHAGEMHDVLGQPAGDRPLVLIGGAEWRERRRHGCALLDGTHRPDLTDPILDLVEDALGFGPLHAADIVLILQQHAERIVDHLGIERQGISSCSAVTQSSVSATPGDL
jgi:hypothetical protein